MSKNKPVPAKKPLVINVSDVAFGGDGIARQDGKVIFIEHAVPGERVEVELVQDKKRFARARILRKLEPAPDAVKPPCKVFGSCGGCDWQHVPYANQLEWKAGFIRSALFKNARYEHAETIKVLPSPETENYRNRIKLKARMTPRRTLEFGYFAKSSHTPVFIAQCPIADRVINSFLSALKDFVFPQSYSWQGDLEVQAIAEQRCLVHFNPNFPPEALAALQQQFPLESVETKGFIGLEDDQGLHYATQAGQFQQVNIKANQFLRGWAQNKIESLACETVLDLFCGSGNLSLQLLRQGRKVWGLEYSTQAIATAAFNVERNQLKHSNYRSGPVHEIHKIFQDLPQQLDCIITDPPRQGMDDSLEEVLRLRPKHILSISCDPNTFGRDLKGMLEQGYVVKELFGIDFFPHTYHVETVAHLSLEE